MGPEIDVAPWLSGEPRHRADRSIVHEAIVEQLDHAFSEFGFAVVVGHGVESATFDSVYEAAKGFFQSELRKKQEYNLGLGYGYGGYLSTGNEVVGQMTGDVAQGNGDFVESLTCRGLHHVNAGGSHGQSPPHFAQDMSDTPFADRIPAELLTPTISLHKALLPFKTLLTRTTERVMGVEAGAFRQTFDPQKGGIRFAYYPELESFSPEKQPLGYGGCFRDVRRGNPGGWLHHT